MAGDMGSTWKPRCATCVTATMSFVIFFLLQATAAKLVGVQGVGAEEISVCSACGARRIVLTGRFTRLQVIGTRMSGRIEDGQPQCPHTFRRVGSGHSDGPIDPKAVAAVYASWLFLLVGLSAAGIEVVCPRRGPIGGRSGQAAPPMPGTV